MKLQQTITALVLAFGLSNLSHASGIPTIDAAGLAQAVQEYMQMMKDYEQALERYEELKKSVTALKEANGLSEIANSLSEAGNDLLTATDTTRSFMNDWDNTFSSIISTNNSILDGVSSFWSNDEPQFSGPNGAYARSIYQDMGLGAQCNKYLNSDQRKICKKEAESIAIRKADAIKRLEQDIDNSNASQAVYASALNKINAYSQGRTPDGRTLTSLTDYVQAQYALQVEMAKFEVLERQFDTVQRALAYENEQAALMRHNIRKQIYHSPSN